MPPKKAKLVQREEPDDKSKGLLEFQMISREKRLETFQDWPFDSGTCTAEKVSIVTLTIRMPPLTLIMSVP